VGVERGRGDVTRGEERGGWVGEWRVARACFVGLYDFSLGHGKLVKDDEKSLTLIALQQSCHVGASRGGQGGERVRWERDRGGRGGGTAAAPPLSPTATPAQALQPGPVPGRRRRPRAHPPSRPLGQARLGLYPGGRRAVARPPARRVRARRGQPSRRPPGRHIQAALQPPQAGAVGANNSLFAK